MSYTTGFYEGRLGIGLGSTMGMGDGNPRYPLDINGDIRLTGSIVNGDGQVLSLVPAESLWTIGTTDITYTGGNVGIGTTTPETLLTVGNHALTNGTRDLVRFSSYRHNEAFTIRNNDDDSNGRLEFFWGNSRNGSGGHDNTVDKSILTLHHTGKVGIGTTTPSQALDVIGSIKSSLFLILNDGYSLYWGDGKSKIAGFGGTTGNIQFNTNSNERMRITAEGYILINQTVDLGLGTGAKLQVNGTGVFCYNGDKDNSISISHNGSRALINSRSTTHNLDFYVNGDPRLSIKPNGNVGIGTTSPGSTLEIKDLTSGTAGEVESILKVNSVSGYHMVSLGTAGPTNYHSGSISIYKTASGTTKSVHLSGSTDHTYFNGGGNVGIGTTSPQTKLDVAGDYSKGGEIISMTSQYGLNAKASIFNDWFREEHTNWGLYWINNVTYNSLDYSTLVPYARTTNDGTTGYVSTGVTGKSMSSLMTAYSPGDRGERIGSTCKDLGTYDHHTFAIHFGYWANGIASTYIRTDDEPWEKLPDTTVGSGTTVDIMFTGYIKCNETNTYYFGVKSMHYYRALLFIQAPNEGTGTMWGFGGGGWQYTHIIRTDGISMTAGKYYKIAFCTHGTGYYYYQGAGIQLGWTKDGSFSTSDYNGGGIPSRLYSYTDIDGKTNWNCRFGWISDDSPLQFVKRIPN